MKEEISLVEQTQSDILKYIAQHSEQKELPKEEELSENLGVSRVVVREALSRLRALGFIETKRKRGSTVITPNIFGVLNTIVSSGLLDRNTLKNLFQLRLMLEIGMADFVLANKTDAQMARLEEIVSDEVSLNQEMMAAETDERRYEIAKQLTEVDVRFHAALFEMTGNESLMDFQYILRHLFTLYFPKIKTDFHERNIISHVDLYNLLRSGTADAFRMAMRLHLTTQFVNMESILDKSCGK